MAIFRAHARSVRTDSVPTPLSRAAASPARGLSRRTLLTLFGAAALAGCSAGSDTAGEPPSSRSPSPSATVPSGSADKSLIWSNWPNYIDVRKKAPQHPTLAAFTAQTGVKVDYREVIEDNESYVATINTDLHEHRPVGTDLMVPDVLDVGPAGARPRGPAARSAPHADRGQEPDRRTRQPVLGPGPPLLDAVAGRADRHRLRRHQGRPRDRQLQRAAHPQGPRRTGQPAHRVQRHGRGRRARRRGGPDRPHGGRRRQGARPDPGRARTPGRCAISTATSSSRH